MKTVSFAALDTLKYVVLLSSAAVPVAADFFRKRSQVNYLSGQRKHDENYANHDVRHWLAETAVATEVVDDTVARMVNASTSMSSSLPMSARRNRSLMSMPDTEVSSATCTCSDGVTVPFPFYGDHKTTICYEGFAMPDSGWSDSSGCDFEYETMYCCQVRVVEENNGQVPPTATSAIAVISVMAVVLAIYFFCKRTSGNRSNNPERIEEGVIPTVVATKVDNPTDFPQVNQVQVEWTPPPPSAPQLNPNDWLPPPPSAPPLEYYASRCE